MYNFKFPLVQFMLLQMIFLVSLTTSMTLNTNGGGLNILRHVEIKIYDVSRFFFSTAKHNRYNEPHTNNLFKLV